MSETSVKKSIQLIHEKFTDLLTDDSHSIIVSSLLKSNQSKYYIFELQSTIIRLIQKDNKGLKREWEYAFNSTGDIFLNNVNVSTELSNEFTKLLSDVSLDINENKVEIFKAESVNSIPKNRSGVISALPGRNEKFLHIKQLSKEELKQISGGCGGIAPIGVGVRPSLSPFTPVTTEHATNTTRMETVMKDLAPNSRLIPNANRDVLPILSGNIETLVDFLRHTPATLSADHKNWSRDIDVTSVLIPVANAMTVEDVNRNQQTQTAKTTSFKDLIKNYQTQKTALKGILDESKRITEPSDEKRVQGTFESGLKTLINAAETIQLKIDMWVDLKGGDKTDKNFEKIRSLQSHLSSDLNKLSDESSQLRNVITADNQPIYERVKDLSLKSAVKVTQFNEGVGAERDVISTPDTTPSLDGLPKPKEAVKMDDFSRLETELNRFLAGTVGTRETHEFSLNSVTYNKTDKTLTIEFNSVGGDTRHKSVVIPFKDHNHFTSLKEAESILKEGSLGPKTESGSKLGSNRLFSKPVNDAEASNGVLSSKTSSSLIITFSLLGSTAQIDSFDVENESQFDSL